MSVLLPQRRFLHLRVKAAFLSELRMLFHIRIWSEILEPSWAHLLVSLLHFNKETSSLCFIISSIMKAPSPESKHRLCYRGSVYPAFVAEQIVHRLFTFLARKEGHTVLASSNHIEHCRSGKSSKSVISCWMCPCSITSVIIISAEVLDGVVQARHCDVEKDNGQTSYWLWH